MFKRQIQKMFLFISKLEMTLNNTCFYTEIIGCAAAFSLNEHAVRWSHLKQTLEKENNNSDSLKECCCNSPVTEH